MPEDGHQLELYKKTIERLTKKDSITTKYQILLVKEKSANIISLTGKTQTP